MLQPRSCLPLCALYSDGIFIVVTCCLIIRRNNWKLSSLQGQQYDVWGLVNIPFFINGRSYKLADFATVQKGQSPQKVAKENQQYRLCLQYEYIGSSEQGKKLLKKDLEEFNKVLPMGYTAENDQDYWSWNKKDNKQYALLLIVIAIIFFTTAILFNSLKQPLAIILSFRYPTLAYSLRFIFSD